MSWLCRHRMLLFPVVPRFPQERGADKVREDVQVKNIRRHIRNLRCPEQKRPPRDRDVCSCPCDSLLQKEVREAQRENHVRVMAFNKTCARVSSASDWGTAISVE